MRFLALAASLLATVPDCLAGQVENDLLWGAYRSNLYFGMRPQIPYSLLTGLMWYNSGDIRNFQNLREACVDYNGMADFGYDALDMRNGGSAYFNDTLNGLVLKAQFVKSDDGLSWTLHIEGEADPESVHTLIYSAALEGEGALRPKFEVTPTGHKGDAEFAGTSPELGKFEIVVTEGKGKRPTSSHPFAKRHPSKKTQYVMLNVPNDNVWRSRDIFATLAQDELTKATENADLEGPAPPAWAAASLNNNRDKLVGNFHLLQKTFQGNFEFDVVYHAKSGSAPPSPGKEFSKAFEKMMEKEKAVSDETAGKVLAAPYDNESYAAFARQIIAKLLGGVSYFYGDTWVASSDDPSDVNTKKNQELLTSVPTRSFFPRGFYWDEGFHLFALMDRDLPLVVSILESWFNLMDEDGWIAREQIIGPQARAAVPEQFIVQFDDFANPPTLVLAVAKAAEEASRRKDTKLIERVEALVPLLERHFEWFRRSQRGMTEEYEREFPSPDNAYRWRGRTPTHVLTSGMDDYPRPDTPSDGELNVDLLTWVGAMARALGQIQLILKNESEAERYAHIVEGVQKNLDDIFWSSENGCYCDMFLNEFEEDELSCHVGYVTHLPFMLKLVRPEDENRLLYLLKAMKDEEQMLSEFGLRSLSKSDNMFGTGENYWRGPIWVNINYLALDALRHYSEHAESEKVRVEASELYKVLRTRLVDNVYTHWQADGDLREQYDAITGEGKGAHHFTGWTALVVEIMKMPSEIDEKLVKRPTIDIEANLEIGSEMDSEVYGVDKDFVKEEFAQEAGEDLAEILHDEEL